MLDVTLFIGDEGDQPIQVYATSHVMSKAISPKWNDDADIVLKLLTVQNIKITYSTLPKTVLEMIRNDIVNEVSDEDMANHVPSPPPANGNPSPPPANGNPSPPPADRNLDRECRLTSRSEAILPQLTPCT